MARRLSGHPAHSQPTDNPLPASSEGSLCRREVSNPAEMFSVTGFMQMRLGLGRSLNNPFPHNKDAELWDSLLP